MGWEEGWRRRLGRPLWRVVVVVVALKFARVIAYVSRGRVRFVESGSQKEGGRGGREVRKCREIDHMRFSTDLLPHVTLSSERATCLLCSRCTNFSQ